MRNFPIDSGKTNLTCGWPREDSKFFESRRVMVKTPSGKQILFVNYPRRIRNVLKIDEASSIFLEFWKILIGVIGAKKYTLRSSLFSWSPDKKMFVVLKFWIGVVSAKQYVIRLSLFSWSPNILLLYIFLTIFGQRHFCVVVRVSHAFFSPDTQKDFRL